MGNELKLKKSTSNSIFAVDIHKSSLVCAGMTGWGWVGESTCDLMPNHRLGSFILSHGFYFYFKFCINLSASISSTVPVKSTECKSVVNNSRKPRRKAWLALGMGFNHSQGENR